MDGSFQGGPLVLIDPWWRDLLQESMGEIAGEFRWNLKSTPNLIWYSVHIGMMTTFALNRYLAWPHISQISVLWFQTVPSTC